MSRGKQIRALLPKWLLGTAGAVAAVFICDATLNSTSIDQPAYDRRYFENRQPGAERSAANLVPVVMQAAKPESVVDVGCGRGAWLAEFRRRGIKDILGIDAPHLDTSTLVIPVDAYRAHDLALPLSLPRSFDLAVCLEVAEHLPETRADAFVSELTRLSPFVLFSAALPGQGGTGHINEQYQNYWAARFRKLGYLPLDIRSRIWNDRNIDWWYRQNVILYGKAEHKGVQDVRLALGELSQAMMDVVHPEFLAEVQNTAPDPGPLALLRSVPQATVRAVRRRAGRDAGSKL